VILTFIAFLHYTNALFSPKNVSAILLLALETATSVCSVALHDGDRVVIESSLHRARTHAERLPVFVREALAHAETPAADLDAVAVSAGPGSYTGLRIGVSTAKGLVEAAGASLVGVPSLEALAARAAPWADAGDLLAPVFESRRGEVYAAVYRAGSEDALDEKRPASPVRLDAASAWLPDGVLSGRFRLLGPGAHHLASALSFNNDFRVVSLAPSAAGVAEIGLRRLRAGKADDPVTFEPSYLKDFVPG
jgi:tRNA threonylcarbamoyladenosine biosynthesis protein TsaB